MIRIPQQCFQPLGDHSGGELVCDLVGMRVGRMDPQLRRVVAGTTGQGFPEIDDLGLLTGFGDLKMHRAEWVSGQVEQHGEYDDQRRWLDLLQGLELFATGVPVWGI